MASPLNAMDLAQSYQLTQARIAAVQQEMQMNAMMAPYRMQALQGNAMRDMASVDHQRNALAFQKQQASERNALTRDSLASRERMGGNALLMRERVLNAQLNKPAKPEKAPAGYRWTRDGNMEAIPGGPAASKPDQKEQELGRTLQMYSAAREGLLSGLDKTETGPFAGRLPALTTGQQVAEGGVSAMAPVLKQIFRVAGEGQFTDKDQELLLGMVPTRKDSPEARAEKISNIDNIVSAKLGRQVGQRQQGKGLQPGIVKDGYRFKGGNPADKNSWEKM